MSLSTFNPRKRLAIRPLPSPGHLVEGLWAWSLSQWSPQKGKRKSSCRWHIRQKTDFCLAWHPSFLKPDPILHVWMWFPPAHVVVVRDIYWAPRRPCGDPLYGNAPFYRHSLRDREERSFVQGDCDGIRSGIWGLADSHSSWLAGGGAGEGNRTQISAIWPGDLFTHSST